MNKESKKAEQPKDERFSPPSVSLPKGGGAIKGIGEKFAANPVTGTGSLTIPLPLSPGRSGFTPALSLSYDSGAGNGPFGFGWSGGYPTITRRTDRGLPQYADNEESDVFILSGAEDLVLDAKQDDEPRNGYRVTRYRPRIEGLFALIERWTKLSDSSDTYWRSISRDNVTTFYGKTARSRIADPTDSTRIFSWLICQSYDDKGNAVVYEYQEEDSSGVLQSQVHEKNRTLQGRSANRYLKRVKYGNRTPNRHQDTWDAFDPIELGNETWMFELVFDYDEGHYSEEEPDVQGRVFARAGIDPSEVRWPVRLDPFSSYRAGFEVRTYRLCRRVLMFHHFSVELGTPNYLVRSTEFNYNSGPIASFITEATQSGYVRQADGKYLKKSFPPLSLQYSKAVINDEIETIDAESLENLPIGVDGLQYQWLDLDGEGLQGILSEQPGAWYYKRNLSPTSVVSENGKEKVVARFAPLAEVETLPSMAQGAGGRHQFLDLAGDGTLDLVEFEKPVSGFFERTDDEQWESFIAFDSLPNVQWNDPNLKFIDLTGDGHADILITEDHALTWYPSLAEQGFERAIRIPTPLDEEQGPAVVFADGTQAVVVADLSGDGLTDIVRIRNGEIAYWPNLGYGRFGAKVTMDNAPWFDAPDQFDQKRIRLADIDGSGTTDIIYLERHRVAVYRNECGNAWSAAEYLESLPAVDNLASVTAVDLLGIGTACLVWSSPLPGHAPMQMRYIDLMGRQKPHLLTRVTNNLGAETVVEYAPSTKFYLADKLAGKPWITRLPFPVHVVERVETHDLISRNHFVTRYSYHHGYFDGFEREFRGFGMVEQWDTEAFEDYVVGVNRVEGAHDLAPEISQPPVTTRTWYHTGAFLAQDRILHQYCHEYHLQGQYLPEPSVPSGLSADELRECLRALKGLPLRQEIYSFDGSPEQQHPYTVTENNFEIRWLQPRGEQRHAVFFAVGRESIAFNYERDLADPRVAHTFGLELDEYGNARKSCSLVYGRKVVDPSLPAEVTRDQQQPFIMCTEIDYTPDIGQGIAGDIQRLRVPFESRSYEITGVASVGTLFEFEELKAKIAATIPIDYEVIADSINPQKRLLSQSRTLFLDNALNALPLGQWDSLGLVHQSYKLAFTPSVAGTQYAGKVTDAEFAAAGYVHFGGDSNWWMPSGTAIYPADPRAHFFLPIGAKDPLGLETIATFDKHVLLIEKVEVKQAVWNVVNVFNDYRVLGPMLVTDPNGNRSAVEHDELGMVIKTAIMGKPGSADGDTLADPTTRIEYELFNWVNSSKPNFVHTFAREQHGAANPRWQESYAYSNGSGGVAMVKTQTHPGKAFKLNPDGSKVEVDADPRWVGNGRTILNNKGKPVKQYEPYFSITHEYEDEKVLREIGVTPVLYYDPVGRNIRTLFANGTFAKIEFTPWMQKVFDANDTVKQSQWYADRGSPDPVTQPEPVNDPERRAAWLAAKHADTPGVIHFDSLGRPVYAVSDYGGGKTASVRSESDLTGRFCKMFDQEQREVASGFVGMAGTPVVGESAEKGRRWTFQNVLGALVKTWDEHGRQFRAEYDILHRSVSTFVQEAGDAEILFNYVVYGDRLANAQQRNLFGAAHLIFDQAGMLRVPELDFKGNPQFVDRVLAKDYKNDLDWSALPAQPDTAAILAAADPALETVEVFTASSLYDALNRPIRVTLPDGTIVVPTYNKANFLASLQAQIRGQGNFIEFLKGQDYDARGQRQFAHYGNEVFTRYLYDPNTFRLTNLLTHESSADPRTQSLQNLNYTYDPVGNITQIRDDAQQTNYFNNAVVKPESLYEYDAIYQLIRATGRELAGMGNDTLSTHTDLDFIPQLPHLNNTDAMRTYTEEYEYDLLGNLKVLRHRFKPQPGLGNGWTRHYRYAFEDVPGTHTNRLTAINMPGDPDGGPFSGTYDYDAYGNMIRMPHLAVMDWNFLDQLRRVDLNGGGTAYYRYGPGGQRLRKVIERNGNLNLEWIFLGAVMIFRRRRRNTNELRLERWTVHISDNNGHIAQVDIKTRDDDNNDPANPLDVALIRYQCSNHLGSAVLGTDEEGNPISYEEYHPYGTTAYRSAKPGFDLSLKRFRFSGKERDEETGLYYFGARYYAPWLGRWTSSDPAGLSSGLNLFRYCRNSPSVFTDPTGMKEFPGKTGVALNPKNAALLDPSREAEARAYLEGVYTSRLDQSEEFHIDHMYFDTKKHMWIVDDFHTSPRNGPEGSSPEKDTLSADDRASEGTHSTTTTPADSPADKASTSPSSKSSNASPRPDSLTNAGPIVEKGIWLGRNFRDRGFTLEHLYNNDIANAIKAQGDNRPLYDVETNTRVKQIKSGNGSAASLEAHASKATRDAGEAIGKNPSGSMAGKSPQAVVITPTDAPASAGADIRAGYAKIRRPVANSVPPEHVRGLPGAVGAVGRGLTVAGTGLSAFALGSDLANQDYSMAGGDALSTVGGGLELYAIASPGATVARVSAMSAGLAVGGIGIAVTSAISGVRAYQRGDYAGAIAGGVGVLAGVAITAGIIFTGPTLLVGGLIAAFAVGLFHLRRWLFG